MSVLSQPYDVYMDHIDLKSLKEKLRHMGIGVKHESKCQFHYYDLIR